MTVPTDPFVFVNGTTADALQVNARYAALYAALNGALDVDNLLAAVKDKLGLSDASVVRRGKSIVAAEEIRTNTAYGTLTTPDQVAGVVLPTDGLIGVLYQASWKENSAGAARAAIFLGSSQVQRVNAFVSPPAALVQEADLGGTAGAYQVLATRSTGLGSVASQAANFSGDVTTGQIAGFADAADAPGANAHAGPCYLFAAAGTYTISVQFKATPGGNNVTAKNRKLWVWTMGF